MSQPGRGRGRANRYIVQEHHARRLHWDLRLEHEGALASWAVPKGIPVDRARNHLAVRTPDHPLEFGSFEGQIPPGEYGAGRVVIWDRGTYDTEKWTDREVKVVLHGERVTGTYVLFRTSGQDWIMRRLDPPTEPDRQPLPERVKPMLAVTGELPPADEDGRWGYEPAWRGARTLGFAEVGRLRLADGAGTDVTGRLPELRELGPALGSTQVLLDGEVVVLDSNRPDRGGLRRRLQATDGRGARRLAAELPVTYLLFDLLHLDGRSTIALAYVDRRNLLDDLQLTGRSWQTVPWFRGGGPDVRDAARDQGLPGIIGKLLDGPYEPGRRSPSWRLIPARSGGRRRSG